jgi:hypothetical protein
VGWKREQGIRFWIEGSHGPPSWGVPLDPNRDNSDIPKYLRSLGIEGGCDDEYPPIRAALAKILNQTKPTPAVK